MPKAYYSAVLDHTADQVWAVIRPFDQYAWAGISGTTVIENERAGDQVGAIRRIVMDDGIVRRQVLLAHSDVERSYTYAICDPPYLPIENYVSIIRITPVTDTAKAFIEWTATFDCDQNERDRWVSFFEKDGFARWLDGLRQHMSDKEPARRMTSV